MYWDGEKNQLSVGLEKGIEDTLLRNSCEERMKTVGQVVDPSEAFVAVYSKKYRA